MLLQIRSDGSITNNPTIYSNPARFEDMNESMKYQIAKQLSDLALKNLSFIQRIAKGLLMIWDNKSVYVVRRLYKISMNAKWALTGDESDGHRFIFNFGGSSTYANMNMEWIPPRDMVLCICMQLHNRHLGDGLIMHNPSTSRGGSINMSDIPTYIFALDPSDCNTRGPSVYNLPLPNVYENFLLCPGNNRIAVPLGGGILEMFQEYLNVWMHSAWNNELVGEIYTTIGMFSFSTDGKPIKNTFYTNWRKYSHWLGINEWKQTPLKPILTSMIGGGQWIIP